MPGGSGPSSSTRQLSICSPARAAITCSIISIATPSRSMAVRRSRGDGEFEPGRNGAAARQVGPLKRDAVAGFRGMEAERHIASGEKSDSADFDRPPDRPLEPAVHLPSLIGPARIQSGMPGLPGPLVAEPATRSAMDRHSPPPFDSTA